MMRLKLKKFKNGSCTMGSVLCILCMVFIGCATSDFGIATAKDVNRMQWDINELRSEVKSIERKSQAIEKQLPGQQGQLNEKLKGLEESQKATAGAVSDLLIKVQGLSGDVQQITGRLEEVQYSSGKSLEELTESREMFIAQVKELEVAVSDLKKRLDLLESKQRPVQEGERQAEKDKKSGGQMSTKKEETVHAEVKDIYMAGYEAYKSGRTKEAREKFMSVLKDYPENEYSDNARFWIAESYYKDKSYEDAILVYEELFRKNPDSDKIPGAMFKQGLAFYALKDEKTGRLILEKLIERYPDSEQAKLARKKLGKPMPVKKKSG